MELQAALSSLLGILKAVNDSMHLIAINGYEVRRGATAYSVQCSSESDFKIARGSD